MKGVFVIPNPLGYPADTFFIAQVTVISAAGQAREIENPPDRAGDRDPGRRTGAGDFWRGLIRKPGCFGM